jgi:hypothetical protein
MVRAMLEVRGGVMKGKGRCLRRILRLVLVLLLVAGVGGRRGNRRVGRIGIRIRIEREGRRRRAKRRRKNRIVSVVVKAGLSPNIIVPVLFRRGSHHGFGLGYLKSYFLIKIPTSPYKWTLVSSHSQLSIKHYFIHTSYPNTSPIHSAATTTPPTTAPNAPNHTPVGAAPAVDELVLALPLLPSLELPVPAAALAVPALAFAAVELVLIILKACVALPVIAPAPWIPVGVKYRLMAVLLGN